MLLAELLLWHQSVMTIVRYYPLLALKCIFLQNVNQFNTKVFRKVALSSTSPDIVFQNFDFCFLIISFFLFLTWDHMGVKISKQDFSLTQCSETGILPLGTFTKVGTFPSFKIFFTLIKHAKIIAQKF